MEKLELSIIKKNIEERLKSQIISGKILLDQLSVIDENSRKTASYLDNKYAPLYYYLGKEIPANSLLEIGFTLGLLSCCFLKSCKTVNKFFGFKEKDKEFVPLRIGKINIKKFVKNIDCYNCDIYEDLLFKKFEEKWDVVIINEKKEFDKQLEYMEMTWPNVSENGFLITEYLDSHKPSKEAFKAFCDNKNIKPVIFKTRYGTGLIQKC